MAVEAKQLEQELVVHLRGLQASLADLKRERTIRTAVGVGGFLAIMGVVLSFASDLHGYATHYPADALTRALGREAEMLVGSPETAMLAVTLRDEARKSLLPAFSQRVQADLPTFHSEIQAMFADVEQYLNSEISQRASAQLLKSAQMIHAGLLQSYGNLPVEGIQQATAAAQAEYVKQLQAMLNGQMTRVAGDVNALQASLAKLSNDPEYAALQQATPEQLATNFYIAVLELAAHNLKQQQAGQSGSAQPVKQGV